MKQRAVYRLAVLLAAAACMTAPPSLRAATKGPDQAANHQTVDIDNARPPARPRRDTYPFRGVIASVDPTEQTVTLAGRANHRVVRYTPETRLIKDGQPATADDLKAGETVGGTLRKNREGREEAVLIRIGLRPRPADVREGSASPETPDRSSPPAN